jgi:hypothetical protein
MVEVSPSRELDQLLNRLPAKVGEAIGPKLGEIAEDEARRIRAAAERTSRLAALAGRSVTAKRTGATATITGGGGDPLPSGRGVYADIFYGAEFGGQGRPTTQQFPPHRRSGYWFFPTISDDQDRITEELLDVLDEVTGGHW